MMKDLLKRESQNTGLYKILDDTWYSSNGTAYYCVEGPGAGNMGVRNSMESILRDKGYEVDVQLSGFGSELRVDRSVPRGARRCSERSRS